MRRLDSRVAHSTTPRLPRRDGTDSNTVPPSGLPEWMIRPEESKRTINHRQLHSCYEHLNSQTFKTAWRLKNWTSVTDFNVTCAHLNSLHCVIVFFS